MKRPVCQITVGNYQFDYVTNLTIFSSWDTFTDTASIILPNKFRLKNKSIIVGNDNIFKRGDTVEIKCGYFPNLPTKFKGFISKIFPDSPLILNCEDRMWLLKQENLVSKTITGTIKDVISYVAPNETVEYDDETANIGTIVIDNSAFINAVKVFEVLKKNYGYQIYFKNEILQVRALRSIIALDNPVHKMGFQNNIIEDNLEYVRDDDTKRVIRFESKQADNSVILLFGYKKDGETVITETPQTGQVMNSWKVPELTRSQIEKLMTDSIDKYIFEGYSGSFTTFLEPSVEHSDRMEPIDLKHVEREGHYLIKSVETRSGIDGGRQVISLQNRIL